MAQPLEPFGGQQPRPNEDKGPAGTRIIIALMTLSTLAVSLRFLARRLIKAPLKADDWTLFLSLLLTLGYGVTGCFSIRHGAGKHMVDIGLQNIPTYLKYQYAIEIIYTVAITAVKASILLTLHRLFAAARLSLVLILIGIFQVCWCIAFTLVFVFQCAPIWQAFQMAGTKCIEVRAVLIASSVSNIIGDFVILVLPLWIIWHLQISRPKKLALTGIFTIGGLACASSIARVPYLFLAPHDSDVSWRIFGAGIWSFSEVCLGILCASLPMMRPLLSYEPCSKVRHSKKGKRDSRLCPNQRVGKDIANVNAIKALHQQDDSLLETHGTFTKETSDGEVIITITATPDSCEAGSGSWPLVLGAMEPIWGPRRLSRDISPA